jgi:hypothetical protein
MLAEMGYQLIGVKRENKMANETAVRCGYPDTLIREFENWLVLLREPQATLGSLELCAKANERAKLERLCRYIRRPAVFTKRLSMTRNGQMGQTQKVPLN